MNAAPRKSKNNAPTRRHRAPRLRLFVQNASGTRAPATHAQLRRWASAALDADARLTLRLVAEEEARALNRIYRGRDYATNVLSFGYSALAAAKTISGDLVLCAPVIAREARAQGKTLRAHLAHLIVHGVLHLQGLDHQRATEAEAMEAEERRILARLGFSDPYRDVATSVHG